MMHAWSISASKSWEGSGIERANGGAPLCNGAGGCGHGAWRSARSKKGVGRLGGDVAVERATPRSLSQSDNPLRTEEKSLERADYAFQCSPDYGKLSTSSLAKSASS